MDVQEVIRARKSIRKYSSRKIPEEKLTKALEAMRLAPSAKNLQPWKFIIINDEGLRRSLSLPVKDRLLLPRHPLSLLYRKL